MLDNTLVKNTLKLVSDTVDGTITGLKLCVAIPVVVVGKVYDDVKKIVK